MVESRRLRSLLLHTVLVGLLVAACSGEAATSQETVGTDATGPTAAPAATEAAPPTAPPGEADERRPAERLTLVAGGDLLIHTAVWESARRYAGGDGFDFRPMFEPIASFVSAADLALCHLEVPLSHDNSHLSTYPIFSAPYELADAIAAAGFDGCSVASNHVLDQGVRGIDATLDHLDRVGLGHSGSARSEGEAAEITSYEINGIRVAHLSYTFSFNGLRAPSDQLWRANLLERDRILADAARARSEGSDIVLVSLHWGSEYVRAPNYQQLALAPALGASPDIDLVIGHHAHVVQPVELVEGTWITYGVGNLLSNMSQPERRDGVLIHVTFAAGPDGSFEVERLAFLPTQVQLQGHLIEIAPPDSWRRTVEAITSRGADVSPVELIGADEGYLS